jgi:hypothetical protein
MTVVVEARLVLTLPTQSLEFYEGVIKQTDASSALMRQQLSEATAENLELQRLIMNQDVRKHETDTKLRIMEASVFPSQRHRHPVYAGHHSSASCALTITTIS